MQIKRSVHFDNKIKEKDNICFKVKKSTKHKPFGPCNSLVICVHTSVCEQWSNLFL